jgi:hypothetical protein
MHDGTAATAPGVATGAGVEAAPVAGVATGPPFEVGCATAVGAGEAEGVGAQAKRAEAPRSVSTSRLDSTRPISASSLSTIHLLLGAGCVF